MRISFSSIAVQPQNEREVKETAKSAYNAKAAIEKRYGMEIPPVMKATINRDTFTFSSTEQSPKKQTMVDGLMAYYLKKANISFKQV